MSRARNAESGGDDRRRIFPTNADEDHVTIVFRPTEDGRVAWSVDVATVAPERLARRLQRLVNQWTNQPDQIRQAAGLPAARSEAAPVADPARRSHLRSRAPLPPLSSLRRSEPERRDTYATGD